MKKDIDQAMIEKMFTLLKDVHTSVKKLEVDVSGLKVDVGGLIKDVSDLKQGQFQHSVAILELKEDIGRVEKRGNETHALLEKVVKKVSDHDDEIKVNLGLYDQHEKRLTTVESKLRLA